MYKMLFLMPISRPVELFCARVEEGGRTWKSALLFTSKYIQPGRVFGG